MVFKRIFIIFLGCKNAEIGQCLKEIMQTPYFRIVVVDDEETVELCGALKVRVLFNRVFSRPVAWLVVTIETVGQTNQPCVTAGSPPYLTIRSC